MARSFKEYETALRAGDSSVWLGSLLWYSVSESVRISHTLLSDALKAVGLESYTPRQPRDEDVFRRVCSAHQRRRVPTNDPTVFENYLVRDVSRRSGKVCKQLVVEAVDGDNNKLSYAPAYQIEFDHGIVAVTCLLPQPHDQAEAVTTLIERDFQAERGALNAYAIRELIRRVLVDSRATIVREGGGVYFIPQERAMAVDSLVALAEMIPNVTVHPVPLIDDEKQKEMVRTAFEAETTGAIDAILGEIENIEKGPEITQDRYVRMLQDMHDVKARTQEYADLLDEKLDGAGFRVQMYEAAMKRLLNHVKAD